MQIGDFVEKDGAAVGKLELAAPERRRTGERPFSWPNSSLSISSVGIAAQLTFHERARCKRALPVDVCGQQLLAHAPTLLRAARSRRIGPPASPAARHAGTRGPIQSSSGVPDQFPANAGSRAAGRPLERVLDDQQHAVAREPSRGSRTRRFSSPRRRRPPSRARRIITAADRSSHCRTSRSKSMPLPSSRRRADTDQRPPRFRSARNRSSSRTR